MKCCYSIYVGCRRIKETESKSVDWYLGTVDRLLVKETHTFGLDTVSSPGFHGVSESSMFMFYPDVKKRVEIGETI